MHGFHSLVVVLGGVRGIRDTQCGFKLFTRSSARRVFHSLHLERWCFDVELLYIAQSMSIPVCEVREMRRRLPGVVRYIDCVHSTRRSPSTGKKSMAHIWTL